MSAPDVDCKVLLIGTEKAGKTAFFLRYAKDTFSENYNPTVGIDFTSETVTRYLATLAG